MRKSAVHIKEVITAFFETHQGRAAAPEEKLLLKWDCIASQDKGGQTRPVSIKNNILLVLVSNSSLLHQLAMQKYAMIEKIGEVIGNGVVRDIRFKIGTSR